MELQKEHWLKGIEIRDLLTKDAELVFDFCGLDVLIALLENLPGITLYISRAIVTAAQKRYIAIHYDGNNVKRLAAELTCSDSLVYQVINGKLSDYLPKKTVGTGRDLGAAEADGELPRGERSVSAGSSPR